MGFQYKVNVLEKLKEKGYNSYILSRDKIFSSGSIQKMRENKVLGKEGLEMLCKLLECDIGDIIEYTDNEKEQE